jgi:hypothetical protein
LVFLQVVDLGTEYRSGGRMTGNWEQRLTQRGVRLEEFAAQAGQVIWRLAKGEYLDEQQSQGRHHVFVDTLNEQGQRMTGIPVEFSWAGGKDVKPTEAKPGEPYAVDFPMFASGNGYHVRVSDGQSDQVMGMGLGSIAQPHMGIHVSYRLVFQKTMHHTNGVPIAPPVEPGVNQPQENGKWQRTLAFVLEQEGGWSDHPSDPGGATMKGITMGTYTRWREAHSQPPPTKEDLRAISDAEVEQIYRQWYWLQSGADGLAWPLCLLVMDTAVLHGVGAATSWFNEVGPNPYLFAAKRLRVYTNSSNFEVFGRGWINRVARLLQNMN